MPKSTVERYEEILAQDPSSSVFVELARALIERGEYAHALEICQAGVGHHRNSIMGRVLWGRALINLGHPADAMEQFDLAIGVDRENPYAYSLISEILLQKGLYRSALPLLRKGASLQTSNGRLKQWLEETERAVAGGPPPILADASPDEAMAASLPSEIHRSRPLEPQEPAAPRQGLEGADNFHDPFDAFSPPLNDAAVPPSLPMTESAKRRALLDDIPEAPEIHAEIERPSARVSSHEAEVIARKYEQELREKLEHTAEMAKLSFVSRHGLKIAVGTVAGVALAVGIGFYVTIRAANHGQDLKDDLANAKKAIAQDTRKSYQFALERLAHAVEMDDGSDEAWALAAYARGILFLEHGGAGADRTAGLSALDKPRVRSRFAGLALASSYYLTDPPQREEMKQAVLESKIDMAEVHELAGRILLARKDSKGAVDRFRRALTASPANVRALVALGDYYREFGDFPAALKFYGTAGQISAAHPARVLGEAESRIELSQELDEALKEIAEMGSSEVLPPDLLARKELAHGRLLKARGRAEEAIQKLAEGARSFKSRAFEFNLALGDANRAAGKMEAAQKAFEVAFAAKPKSEQGKEALGKILIARDREKELLSRFPSEGDARRVSLVRGLAYAKMGEWKHARLELARTQVNGKVPTEAAIELARADAAEDQADRAQAVLEKLLGASRKAKSDVRIALGSVLWQRGVLDKARAQFEEASKDPEDYEGLCALGRMQLSLGSPAAAIEPLTQALARNPSHGEAHRGLGRAYLELGNAEKAIAQFEAWRADQPASGAASKNLALALYYSGKLKEADAAITRALGLDPDGEGHRVRGMVLFSRGEPRSAFRELERASKIPDADADTYCELGAAYVRAGKTESALKAYEVAQRQEPRNPCGKIGVYYARLPAAGKPAAHELADVAQKAPQVWNKSLALAVLARVHLANGAAREARKAGEQAVALAPNSAAAHLALGMVALRQRDEPKGKEELVRSVELDPSVGMAHLALADSLARSEQTRPQAVEHYQTFLRIGGAPADQLRVRKTLANLKKKLASR